MPAGAGVNAAGLALCWTSAALGEKGQTPRVGIPSYILIAHLLAQKNMDDVIREVRKNKHRQRPAPRRRPRGRLGMLAPPSLAHS
jgi:hypothetical protein